MYFGLCLDAGVVGGCGELCQLLADKTNSSLIGTVCDLLCDYVGIKEFIDLIQKYVYFTCVKLTCSASDIGHT